MKKLSVVLLAALFSGCGGSTGTDSSYDPPEPTPTPSWPDGIFVAPHTGSASGAGTASDPLDSINAALAKAAEAGLHDVWVIGGAMDEEVREVVVLREGIHLHGSVCPTAPMKMDTVSCRTTIVDASPGLIAENVNALTIVENLKVVARDAVEPSTPSVAAEIKSSNGVYLRSVELVAGLAGHGVDGVTGQPGVNGANGKIPQSSLAPGAPGTTAACPEARGGAGGRGGYFSDAVTPHGIAGETSPLGGPGGAGGAFVWYWQRANHASDAPAPADDATPGIAGAHGTRDVDPMTLTAGSGAIGGRGRAGRGGGGGAGGAAATAKLYDVQSNGAETLWFVNHYGYGGYSDGSKPFYLNMGEQRGGAGGGGGSGGCGGDGGTGGTGGASSIALVLRDSLVKIEASRLAGGTGGNGGVGGEGGLGGNGGLRANGSNGGVTQPFRPGTFTNNVWSPNSTSANETDDGGASASIGGNGSDGANGRRGGIGGIGGHGTGGASIAIFSVSSSVAADPATQLVPGTAGLGGRLSDLDAAPDGIKQAIVSLQ